MHHLPVALSLIDTRAQLSAVPGDTIYLVSPETLIMNVIKQNSFRLNWKEERDESGKFIKVKAAIVLACLHVLARDCGISSYEV